MAAPYATPTELGEFLPADTVIVDAERLLRRASELLDTVVFGTFEVDSATELPTDTDVAAALRDACCAQVEFWAEVGEEHDVAGLTGAVRVGNLALDRLPPVVAPRAVRILAAAGLMTQGVGVLL